MPHKISMIRRAIQVFQSYGIQLTGKRKFDHFYDQLKMDKIFVSGLIFELEYALKKEIPEDEIHTIQSPSQAISLLIPKEERLAA